MREKKHLESIKETLDEIQKALEDPRGLKAHQRRLAFMLSTGVAELLEIYLHREGIMKPGARIKHSWLRRKNPKEKLKNQVTGDLNQVEALEEVIEKMRTIEKSRNDIAYGSPVQDKEELENKIDIFLEIKETIEQKTGEKIE